MPPNIPVVAVPIIIGLVAAGLSLDWWLFRRLRTRHPITFEELGRPKLMGNDSQPNWEWIRFFWSSRPSELGDGGVTRAVWLKRLLAIGSLVMLIWLISCIV